jgi:phosphopantetheine--protein transferase-like protein
MISGVGIDIVAIKRFNDYSDKSDIRLSKLFTAGELNYCFGHNTPSNSLAGKFAAKEAIIKILINQGIAIME